MSLDAWESESEREGSQRRLCVSSSSISILLQLIANYGVRLYVKAVEGE